MISKIRLCVLRGIPFHFKEGVIEFKNISLYNSKFNDKQMIQIDDLVSQISNKTNSNSDFMYVPSNYIDENGFWIHDMYKWKIINNNIVVIPHYRINKYDRSKVVNEIDFNNNMLSIVKVSFLPSIYYKEYRDYYASLKRFPIEFYHHFF